MKTDLCNTEISTRRHKTSYHFFYTQNLCVFTISRAINGVCLSHKITNNNTSLELLSAIVTFNRGGCANLIILMSKLMKILRAFYHYSLGINSIRNVVCYTMIKREV